MKIPATQKNSFAWACLESAGLPNLALNLHHSKYRKFLLQKRNKSPTLPLMTNRPIVLAFAFLAAPVLCFAQTPAAPADTNVAPAAPAAPVATTPAPAPAAPADTTVPASERPATYTIAQGDSLWSIAHKYGTTVVALRKLNNLKKGALLHPGQVLQMPPAKADAAAK